MRGPSLGGRRRHGEVSILRFDVIGDPVNTAARMLVGYDFAITQQVATLAERSQLDEIVIPLTS